MYFMVKLPEVQSEHNRARSARGNRRGGEIHRAGEFRLSKVEAGGSDGANSNIKNSENKTSNQSNKRNLRTNTRARWN